MNQEPPAWDQPESPEEARLLQAALARPQDPDAQAALGRHYQAAGSPFEAAWALQRARDARATNHQSPDPAMTLAMAGALEAGRLPTRALALLDEAAAKHPPDPSIAFRRAELQLRQGRPEAALTTLRSVTPSPHHLITSSPPPLLLGRALEAAGQEEAALAAYRRAGAEEATAAAAQLRIGRLQVRRGKVEPGRKALETAHRLAPTDPEPPYALGMSYMPEAGKNPDRAGRWFSEVLKIAPDHGPTHVALGQIALLHRQWKLAAQHLEQALGAHPRDPEVRLGLARLLAATGYQGEAREHRGLAYVAQGKLPQALAEFRALKAAEPGSPKAAMLISQTLIQMEQTAAAAAEVKKAADRYPQDLEIKQRLAQLYIDSLSRDAARRICEEWRQADPAAAKPLWLLGRIALLSPPLRSQAIDHFEQALRLAPQDPEITFALGDALSRPGSRRDPQRALSLLGRAVELAPREARYRYQLGFLLQQMDRPEPARRQFLRTLDRDPALTGAYTGLIQIAGKLREPGLVPLFAPVVRDQQEAQRLEPTLRRRTYQAPADPTAYAALARYLAERGDLKAAHAQWEVVLTLMPEDTVARHALARLDRILAVL